MADTLREIAREAALSAFHHAETFNQFDAIADAVTVAVLQHLLDHEYDEKSSDGYFIDYLENSLRRMGEKGKANRPPVVPPAPESSRLPVERATRVAELRRLQREIRDWSVSQMIWPTMEEVLTLVDKRCAELQAQADPPLLVEAPPPRDENEKDVSRSAPPERASGPDPRGGDRGDYESIGSTPRSEENAFAGHQADPLPNGRQEHHKTAGTAGVTISTRPAPASLSVDERDANAVLQRTVNDQARRLARPSVNLSAQVEALLPWLDEAVTDWEARNYRPSAHFIKLFRDAARLLREQRDAL